MKMLEMNLFNIKTVEKEKVKIIIDEPKELKQIESKSEPESEKEEPVRDELKEIEEIKFNRFQPQPIDLNEYLDVYEYINNNSKDGIAPGIAAISTALDKKISKIQKIHNTLKKLGYLTDDNKKIKIQDKIEHQMDLNNFDYYVEAVSNDDSIA